MLITVGGKIRIKLLYITSHGGWERDYTRKLIITLRSQTTLNVFVMVALGK